MPSDKVYSVSGITRRIRNLLEIEVGEVWIEGEVSNLRKQASGHQYFTLKDEGAQISCVLFRGNARNVKVDPENGMQVQAFGEISVYEPRGAYQIIIRHVQPVGLGQLQARFEALKTQLAAEGLFAQDKKRPIPRFPQTVAIVTSPTGAALQDILNVLERRAPWLRVLVYPVRVQGDEAAGEIAQAIYAINATTGNALPEIDTLIIARGGGSLEDLWAFNEEAVARAVASSEIPTVVGVGHEIDFSIADFAADLRAPTPSAAAELIVPDTPALLARIDELERVHRTRTDAQFEAYQQLLDLRAQATARNEPSRVFAEHEQSLDYQEERLAGRAREALAEFEGDLEHLSSRLNHQRPDIVLDGIAATLDHHAEQLTHSITPQLNTLHERLEGKAALLQSLGPQATLARGFSLTTTESGEIITKAKQVKMGQVLNHVFAEGEVTSEVTKTQAK